MGKYQAFNIVGRVWGWVGIARLFKEAVAID